MTDRHTPVLIVGAGLAGLTAALLLAWRGIPSLLVEKRASTSRHPRARGVNLRSMELLRVVPGLENELRAASRATMGEFTIVIAQSVASPPLKTILPPGGFDASLVSPAVSAWAGQDRIEPILARRAAALGAELEFSTELLRFSQDAAGVRSVLRDADTGEQRNISADYLIAADGCRSPVREALGIATQGPGAFAQYMTILFETDVPLPARERGLALYYLRNPAFTGAFVTTDEPNIAQVAVEYDPTREGAADYSPERSAEIVRAALGAPTASVKVLGLMDWEMSSRVAESFGRGRVFLAGDAAHTMPPTGGLGGQTAIQDAADLSWKLALVLQGRAGPALLDTYNAERQPVGALTAARQTANYVERMRPDRKGLADPDLESDYLSLALGYLYRSAAVATETPDDGCKVENPLTGGGRPGSRLPHLTLLKEGGRLSTHDLVGREFVLLSGPDGAAWTNAARALKQRFGLPIEAFRVGADAIDCEGLFLERTGLGRDGALLVRPDGFIAWRSRGAAFDPLAALAGALGRALLRPIQLDERAA